jgi:outer membrane protein assembly factor BamB
VRLSRGRLAAGTAALVIAAGGGTYVWLNHADGYGERFTRPAGAYPAAPTGGSSLQVIGKATGDVTLLGSLAVIGSGTELKVGDSPALTGPENGLTAASVRTGQAYWTYSRPKHGVRASSNGGKTDLLYVLWDDGLLVRINTHTGKVVWHHKVDKTFMSQEGTPRLATARTTGLALLISSTRVDAVAAADGKARWSATISDGSHVLTGWPAIGADTLTFEVTTKKSTGKVITFDLRSGAKLWERDDDFLLWPLSAEPGKVLLSSVRGKTPVVDARTGRDLTRFSAGKLQLVDVADGSVLGNASGPRDPHDPAFGAFDIASGKKLWTADLPTSREASSPPQVLGKTLYAPVKAQGEKPRLFVMSYRASDGSALGAAELPVTTPEGENADVYAHEVRATLVGYTPGLIAVSADEGSFGTSEPSVFILQTGQN